MSDVTVVGGLMAVLVGLVFFFKGKADKSKRDAILGETKGRDKGLAAAEKVIQDKIEEVMNQDDSKLTPEERAKRWD